jgi:imidazolonepropionase-like amidohydrolase
VLLRGGVICDGSAPPRPATLLLQAGRIAAVLPPDGAGHAGEGAAGSGSGARIDGAPADARAGGLPAVARVIDCRGHLITPGLIDAHTHLFSSGSAASYEAELLHASLPLRTLRGAANARRMLADGFTTVRDVCTEGAGYADVALRDAIAERLCDGPRVVPSGPGIGITGGYLPMGIAPGVCVPTGCAIRDGEGAIRQEVRSQVSCGVAWIKVFADWPCTLPSGLPHVAPTFTAAELSALVDEASRRGRRVAAHVTSDAGARQAIACGIASLEHLGSLSRETLDLAAARGVYLVPTLSVFEHEDARAVGAEQRARAEREREARAATFAQALAAGVPIANGSDIGAYPHALGARSELRLLMEFGMTPLAALAAATGSAARLLGAPDLGVIAPLATADLCVFRLATGARDLGATLRGGAPVMVFQDGEPVRDAGALPSLSPA